MSDHKLTTIIAALLSIPLLFSAGCKTGDTIPATQTVVQTQVPPPLSPDSPADQEILTLGSFFSSSRMMGVISDLAEIQPYSGWRSSATSGEAEALDYLASALGEMSFLNDLGLELERQAFHVLLATEIWESRLLLTVGEQEIEVPANGISGHREQVSEAMFFDSDGVLNDVDRDQVEVGGLFTLLRTEDEILNAGDADVQGKVVFLDFRVVEARSREDNPGPGLISALIGKNAAAVVLVTESPGGKYASDGTNLKGIQEGKIPILVVRLEDLAPAGVSSWDDLGLIKEARLIWDADVFSPGFSGNLVARIPGVDPSRAVVLGAHIDSFNTPGASDNALNAAVLIEVAAILDEVGYQPPADIYLAWVGSEELGFQGAQHFVSTHSEVLDRTLGALMLDGFTAEESEPIYAMQASSYARFGDTQTPFASYLEEKAGVLDVPIEFVVDSPVFASDEGPFFGFVPAVRFAFGSSQIGRAFHSPYDDLSIIQDQTRMMENSVLMALAAAIGTPLDDPRLRVPQEPAQRALILASHTDPLHMGPSTLINFMRALSWVGFDVDVIPYGESFTAEDLAGTGLVLALPVVDYPSLEDPEPAYDQAWLSEEVDLLVDYVEGGGFLILAGSANRLFFARPMDPNEDWLKVNALAEPFGIVYQGESIPITSVPIQGEHPITDFYGGLAVTPKNGIPFTIQAGEPLAYWQDNLALAIVGYGENGGEVLAFADIGSLDFYDFNDENDLNQTLLKNLAAYASGR